MKTIDLSREEILENISALSKAELLDVVYDEVFTDEYEAPYTPQTDTNSYEFTNENAFRIANEKASEALESVEHMTRNELESYIINTFL